MTHTISPRVAANDMPSRATSPVLKRSETSRTSRCRMMFRSSSMIRSEKSHRKICPVSMRMISPSIRAGRISDDCFSDHDRAVCLQDLQRPDSPLVVARYFQQNFSARSGAEQNIVLLKKEGLFETRYSDFEVLSWKRPPIARAPRRRSTNVSSSAFQR